jgi:hypothetical protein
MMILMMMFFGDGDVMNPGWWLWEAARSVVVSITVGKRFLIPSINHYKIAIQEETWPREHYRSKNELQDATQKE